MLGFIILMTLLSVPGSTVHVSRSGANETDIFGGKLELTEVEILERYVVEKRANYDRLIIICWHIYTNKQVVHMCRE